jgi:hypothetical protein
MNTALVKPSKTVKGFTSTVRAHLDAVERAREIYLAQIKRAEADYFDRITRATTIIAGEETAGTEPPSATPADAPPANSSAV